jgi:nitrogen-specific signal transduction histidine kinase/CheY-like chemotaxis protein
METNSKNTDGVGAFSCCPDGSAEEVQRYIVQKLDIVGQLAGGISHNFNNQLTGIMGFANLIALRAENENIKKFAEEIIGICKNAGDMVRELLSFARYRPMTATVLNVNNAITTVANLLANSIDKRIEIATSLSATPCNVFADAVQLQSLLLNIALNSKDAMPAGGKLTFSTTHVDAAEGDAAAPCGYVRIEIADTGHGFDDAVKARIFEPFFTTKAQGHPGLGLPAAYNLVTLMNGTIDLNSEVDKGTSVAVKLPIHSDTHGAGAVSSAAAQRGGNVAATRRQEAKSGGGEKKSRGTILLVDDDSCIRESLSAFLKGNDYGVFTAVDGLDAVEKYGMTDGRSIDLVILDMVMPRMDGKEAFIKMKEINPSIKAIGITGYTNYTKEEMAALGIKKMFHKPFAFEELSNAVAEYIRH